MKEIKTDNYNIKMSQFNSIPGDPGYPPGVTNRTIDEQFGSPEEETDSGVDVFEITRDWDNYALWYNPEINEILPVGVKIIKILASYKASKDIHDHWQIDSLDVRKIVDNEGKDITRYELHDDETDQLKTQIIDFIIANPQS